MSNFGKTTRYALVTLAVMGVGFWVGVTFLGENWSDQRHYLFTLLSMLAGMLLSAALLVGVFKLFALAWNKVIDRMAPQQDEPSDHNPQS